MKEQLGTIRVVVSGAVFEIPYSEEDMFDKLIERVRATNSIQTDSLFIPLNQIDFIVKVPENIKQDSEFVGMTKQ